ncbi:hypothetical protein NQ314_012081 [Rhamnusium bicolor]|uniref:Uncharacterized protein n=1 Tax=Rhamnusium bicolor TaxID=1586634 RepID=A0AAV8XEP6_9CUCU|nr:hypothetical protein NQ314_012081 [Rhamnusium bicolor]
MSTAVSQFSTAQTIINVLQVLNAITAYVPQYVLPHVSALVINSVSKVYASQLVNQTLLVRNTSFVKTIYVPKRLDVELTLTVNIQKNACRTI